MQITIEITPKQMMFVAECVTDDLFYEFGRTVTDLAGVKRDELHEGLIAYKPFQDMIAKAVREDGITAVDEPYDFMDFDCIHGSKEWARLWDACEEMQAIIADSEKDDSAEEACKEAIKTLKSLGFKITKA